MAATVNAATVNAATIYDCRLRVDSPLYYTTREVGRLYETGDHLHNFALTYALRLVAAPYYSDALQPSYQHDLEALNERGIYVTPARPIRIHHTITSLKFGAETWREPLRDKSKTGNQPNYGKIKEIAPESEFAFYVIAAQQIKLPRWIRMGIWNAKCEVVIEQSGVFHETRGIYDYPYPLNPVDLSGQLLSFDVVPMPPNSLVRNCKVEGWWWSGKFERPSSQGQSDLFRIPARMAYLQVISQQG